MVAYQTYVLIKELLQLDGAMHRPAYCSDPTYEQLAKALVAEPHPVQILSAELDDETKFLTGICADSPSSRPQRGSSSSASVDVAHEGTGPRVRYGLGV